MQATKNRKHGKSHKTAPTRSNEPPAAPPRQLHITCEKQTRLVGLRHQSLPHPILRRERHYRFKKKPNTSIQQTAFTTTHDSAHDFLRNVWSTDHVYMRAAPGNQT